ncbi:MAG TPA: response regulator transcription factor [Anaerolineae bacterium]|nr:response regulator transcription factor [Anaerolineae bacterium]
MSDRENNIIRVIVADDHPIVRSGIKNELARCQDIQVIAEAVSGDEALALAKELKPDVLLLDINMPGLQAVNVVRRLRAESIAPRVAVLSVVEDAEHVVAMLSAGARGYIVKDEPPSAIVAAMRAVAQGTLWLSAAVAPALRQAMEPSHGDTPGQDLTPREREVLRMMARGWSNQRIAQELSVTEATVKFHIGHIYDKLGAASRVEAVLCAARWALVDLTSD